MNQWCIVISWLPSKTVQVIGPFRTERACQIELDKLHNTPLTSPEPRIQIVRMEPEIAD